LVTATTLNTFSSNWRRNHETVVSGHMVLFGTLKDVQMRQRRNGHVFFVTSMGGLRPFPGPSAYHGSKFALEGIAATIAQEVAPFGIHVTAVESGSLRTDWAGRSMTRVRRTITDTSYPGRARPAGIHRPGRQRHRLRLYGPGHTSTSGAPFRAGVPRAHNVGYSNSRGPDSSERTLWAASSTSTSGSLRMIASMVFSATSAADTLGTSSLLVASVST